MNIFIKNFNTHISTIPSRTKDMYVHKKSNLTFVDVGFDNETYNLIHITNGHHISEHEIQSAINHFNLVNRPYRVWIGKNQLNENVKSILDSENLHLDHTLQGYKLDLIDYKTPTVFQDSSIRSVQTKEDIQFYAAILDDALTAPQHESIQYFQKTSRIILEKIQPITYVLYIQDGKPVAGIEMCMTDHEVMGIYGLASIVQSPDQMIEKALIQFTILQAQSAGIQSILFLSDGLHGNLCKTLGFKIVTHFYNFVIDEI